MLHLLLILYMLPCPMSVQAQVLSSPFAMSSNGSVLTNPEYRTKMLDAGATLCRIDASFPTVRPVSAGDPNSWDWSLWEHVRQARKQQPALHYLAILGYGTAWAADPTFASAPGGDIASPQRGASILPASSPDNLYGQYVYEAVRRNKDIVKCWESWNEPDLPGHSFFKGDGHDFFAYQKACYLSAKAADPGCTVLFAGMCFASVEGYLSAHGLHAPSPDPPKASFFEQYLQECVKDPEARKNHYYFDVMNQHSYSRASDLYDYVMVDRKLMRDYLNEEKPVWITEMGMSDQGGQFGGTSDEYCDYVLQSYAWGELAGVSKFFWFQLDNSNGLGLYAGMLGAPKPALTTYRDVLVRELGGAKLVGQLHGSPGVGFLQGNSVYNPSWQTGYNLFEFAGHGGKRLYLAFADTSDAVTIQIPARSKRAMVIDRHNVRTVIAAEGGFYTLRLSGATNMAGWPMVNMEGKALGKAEHLVGGATELLIEDAPAVHKGSPATP